MDEIEVSVQHMKSLASLSNSLIFGIWFFILFAAIIKDDSNKCIVVEMMYRNEMSMYLCALQLHT